MLRVIGWPTLRGRMLMSLAALVVLTGAFAPAAEPTDRGDDELPDGWRLGRVIAGVVYLELPLAALDRALATPRSDPEYCPRRRDGGMWPDTGRHPYGGSVCPDVDQAYLGRIAALKKGDTVRVRTATQDEHATVTGHVLLHFDTNPGAILLAEARPAVRLRNSPIAVSAPTLPRCGRPCSHRSPGVTAAVKRRIRTTLSRSWEGARMDELVVVSGRFTRRDRLQYVAYASYLRKETDWLWRTVVLDSDLSVIAVLGEDFDVRNAVSILPFAASDADGDGLDEIWVDMPGYEGDTAGIVTWAADRKEFLVYRRSYQGL